MVCALFRRPLGWGGIRGEHISLVGTLCAEGDWYVVSDCNIQRKVVRGQQPPPASVAWHILCSHRALKIEPHNKCLSHQLRSVTTDYTHKAKLMSNTTVMNNYTDSLKNNNSDFFSLKKKSKFFTLGALGNGKIHFFCFFFYLFNSPNN